MRSHRLTALLLAGLVAVGVAGPAAAKIKIHKIRYDPPGADYTTDSQLRAEYIVIRNTGNRRRQLRGWIVKDQGGHGFKFPRYRIPADGYVKVHTGSGRNQRGDLYWGLDNFVWNNDGDAAALRYQAKTRDDCSYAGGESPNPPKYC